MLSVRVIPCLDVRHGRVVKGVRFQGLEDLGSPASLAAEYEAQGADEVVLLDVVATAEGRGTQLDTVASVRECLSVPLTVGGGVRTVAHAEALLEAGADRIAVNTSAVERPALLSELANRFGTQCVVVAIDAARANVERDGGRPLRHEVVVRSGSERTGLDATEWASRAADAGAGEILLTSFDRDGTREGYDLDLLAALRSVVRIPIVASGGADSPLHMAEAVRAGADAVLAASIFHRGEWTVGRIKGELATLGVGVRPPEMRTPTATRLPTIEEASP